MQSDLIADRRRLFELFTTLKDRATLHKDQLAAQVIDETISLVSLQNSTSLSASYPILMNRSIPGSCRVQLQDQNMSANPLAKVHRQRSVACHFVRNAVVCEGRSRPEFVQRPDP